MVLVVDMSVMNSLGIFITWIIETHRSGKLLGK